MGYGWRLSIYCPEVVLPQSMAYPTCVHTLVCFVVRTFVSFQSGKDPRTLCSVRMPL